MKTTWKLLAGLSLIMSSAILTSCVKGDFDEPPLYIPTVDFEANKTISELKATYTGLRLIEEDIIISGVVVANDESGNLFKKLIIQDETAGIELAIDKTNLYNEFKLGQRVYVKCKGMYIGDFNNLIQLGYLFNNDIGRLPEVFMKNHIFRDSLAGPVPEPKVTALNQLNSSLISTLVKFESVRFNDIGQEWAPQTANATNRTMTGTGGSLVVRTSKFSNFAGDLIPAGYGNLTGILSIFGSTYQLIIRDVNDIGEFGGEPPPPPPGTGDGSKENPYTIAQAIQLQNANPNVVGFIKGYIVGSVKSGVSSVGSAEDIHWSAPFTSTTNVLLADSANETNYLNCVIVNLPAGTPLRTDVNLVDNPGNFGKWLNVKGTLRTYFGVAGLRDSSGASSDFELEGGSGGGGGGGGGGNIIFSEDFNTTLGSFTGYSVLGSQVWIWRNFDGGCAVMSGFVSGSSHANEDWLISPAISLAGHTGVMMNFREAINYITSINDLKVLISTDYDGTSNPSNQGTWNELTGFTRAPGTNWTFINSGDVSLAAYEGQTIRIAFKFLSSASASSTWEISRVEVKN